MCNANALNTTADVSSLTENLRGTFWEIFQTQFYSVRLQGCLGSSLAEAQARMQCRPLTAVVHRQPAPAA